VDFSSFIDGAAPPAALIDASGIVREANVQFLAIFELPRDGIAGQERASLLQISHREAFRRLWSGLPSGQTIQSRAPHLGAKDVVWVDSTFMPINAGQAKEPFVLELARASQSEVEAIGLRNALDLSCAVAEIEVGGELRSASASYCRLFGIDPNACSGLGMDRIWRSDDRGFPAIWSDILEGNSETREERQECEKGHSHRAVARRAGAGQMSDPAPTQRTGFLQRRPYLSNERWLGKRYCHRQNLYQA